MVETVEQKWISDRGILSRLEFPIASISTLVYVRLCDTLNSSNLGGKISTFAYLYVYFNELLRVQ